MRRRTLETLRCPKCHGNSLVPEAPAVEAAVFGPVRCLGCSARYPVNEGLIDLVGDRVAPRALQQAMELQWVARSWERYLRPAVDLVLSRHRIDLDSEYALVHSMLGAPPGPVADLGCGSGVLLRRLVADFPEVPLIGVDVSRAMIDEAMAQLHEHGLGADFVRAEVPPLPFGDAALGGLLAAGFVHFVADLDGLFREVARVLKPGGRLVASTVEPSALARTFKSAGVYPRNEAALRQAAAKAGLVRFERVKAGSMLVWKTEQP